MPNPIADPRKAAFYEDGTLLDIYILNTDLQDWQKLLDFLHAGFYPLEFSVGHEPQALPQNIEDIFRSSTDEGCPLLRIDQARLAINCHFAPSGEIEFDLDPHDFQESQQIDLLVDFIRNIGTAVGKPTILSGYLFRFDPLTGEEIWNVEGLYL